MLEVFYSDYGREVHVPSNESQQMDLESILRLMDQVLVAPDNFLGVVDKSNHTLQFIVNPEQTIWMEIPIPAQKGSYGKDASLEDCKLAVEQARGSISVEKIPGLRFQAW
jgi:hypothetical protein